ncbi:hypothetical protein AK812_SmicGene25359 [Symbiodinium microadriaticum]|uniref:Uncharacterized protein n=1 Tax=Symbiodinium microadriaticum TaxID=2951 RepID=A0A1Q9DC44_SYMMI|nr:hypothetical protein AK812_SmicGene25359 [Symbiodinium microadriaticum]
MTLIGRSNLYTACGYAFVSWLVRPLSGTAKHGLQEAFPVPAVTRLGVFQHQCHKTEDDGERLRSRLESMRKKLRRGGASEVRQFVAQKLDAIFRKGLEDFGSPGNCLHQLMVLDFADRLSQTRDPNIDLLLCVSDGLIEQDTISQAFRVNGTIYQLILHDNGKGVEDEDELAAKCSSEAWKDPSQEPGVEVGGGGVGVGVDENGGGGTVGGRDVLVEQQLDQLVEQVEVEVVVVVVVAEWEWKVSEVYQVQVEWEDRTCVKRMGFWNVDFSCKYAFRFYFCDNVKKRCYIFDGVVCV